MKKDGGRTPSVRPTTPAENLMILRSRLWDQLSPAERDELHDASAILAHRSETATPNLCSKHGGYGFTSDCRLCNATPQERATAAQSSSPGGDVPACVARYELENIGWRDDNFAMIENEHGDYVKWDDVKHLFAPSATKRVTVRERAIQAFIETCAGPAFDRDNVREEAKHILARTGIYGNETPHA